MNAPLKWRRILAVLATGRKLHRFDAEKIGDHTLPQTIQKIHKNTGIRADRKYITLPGWCGTSAHVAQYWLNAESTKRALEILSGALK